MRLVPKRWHNETWICSIKGHAVPAASAARLRPDDDALGVDLDDGTRISRCLRCDIWLREAVPTGAGITYDVIPPIDELDLPRRGKPLQDAIFLRLIALDRGFHAVLFGLLAVLLIVVEVRLPAIHDWAASIADNLHGAADNTAQTGSHVFLNNKLESLASLESGEILVLIITATAYAVIEGVEAVFLWKERRWAEYLTVVATVGFIPFELKELVERVTVLRVGALVVNLVMLVWLVWNKRLFGANGGAAALEDNIDWEEILSNPVSPPKTPVEH
jgi:uncharacterized membrane protein (DUF2068 family)